MLYDNEFIKNLPCDSSWSVPLVVNVAKERTEKHKNFKKYIESWYSHIPCDKKNSYRERLRSLDDKEFKAQVNEFLVADFCKKFGSVEFNPELENGKTPDLLWQIDDQKTLLDVVTLFEMKEVEQEQKAACELIKYLEDVDHYFDMSFSYETIDQQKLKPSIIKRDLVNYLDGLNPLSIEPNEELVIEDYGIVATFEPVQKNEQRKSKVEFLSVCHPARIIEPVNAIKKRIKSKLSKYNKWPGPIFVAVCKGADFGMDWEELAEVLYGPVKLLYNPNTKQYIQELDVGGFVMGKGLNPPKNTSLSGVFHCEVSWEADFPMLVVKYLINPHAARPVELSIPTYPRLTCNQLRFEWLNTEADLGHH